MNFETSYLGSSERVELIEDYILHEVRKLDTRYYARAEIKIRDRISDQHAETFKAFQNQVGTDVETARKALTTYTLAQKWMLFHAFSYGALYKKLFTCVGWNELSWQKVFLPCSALQFETRTNFLHEIDIQQPLFTDALNYAQQKYARSGDDGFLKNQTREYANAGEMERLHDPIICRKEGSHYVIHDGTGRMLTLCVNIVLNQVKPDTEIAAWAGKYEKPTMRGRRVYTAARKELFTINRDAQMVPPADKQRYTLRYKANAVFQRAKRFIGLPADD